MVLPSGAKAAAVGWLPRNVLLLLGQVGIFTSVAARFPVSIKVTESECPLATASSLLSGLRESAVGCKPTETSLTDRVSRSTTLMEPELAAPVTGSLTTWEPLEGASTSPGRGRRPPGFETKIFPT